MAKRSRIFPKDTSSLMNEVFLPESKRLSDRGEDFLAFLFWASPIGDDWRRHYYQGEELDLSKVPLFFSSWVQQKGLDEDKFAEELTNDIHALQRSLERILHSDSLQNDKGESPDVKGMAQAFKREMARRKVEESVATITPPDSSAAQEEEKRVEEELALAKSEEKLKSKDGKDQSKKKESRDSEAAASATQNSSAASAASAASSGSVATTAAPVPDKPYEYVFPEELSLSYEALNAKALSSSSETEEEEEATREPASDSESASEASAASSSSSSTSAPAASK